MKKALPTFKDSFTEIIGQPSISSIDQTIDQSNRGVVEMLANWFSDFGFTVELMQVSKCPEKFNLIACAGKGEGGLVLSGHTDTVPVNEPAWHQDPFRLTERDNKFYGLGTSDMKSFFPIILEALKGIDLAGLQQPLYILATCDEESTMSGAKALADSRRSLGRFALIGEPTGLKPVNMHKGIILESIKLKGRAGHASDPALGVSALEGVNSVITALIDWRRQLQETLRDPAFKVPVPTLNFGSIHGGDNPNRICASCELNIDMRLLPQMEIETVRTGLRRTVMEAIDGSGIEAAFESIFPGMPGMITDADAEIVRYAEKLAGEPAGSVAFGTEGPYLNAMGMESLVLGPGDIEQAHQANEYLAMERIEPMIRIVKKMVEHFCMGPSEKCGV